MPELDSAGEPPVVSDLRRCEQDTEGEGEARNTETSEDAVTRHSWRVKVLSFNKSGGRGMETILADLGPDLEQW